MSPGAPSALHICPFSMFSLRIGAIALLCAGLAPAAKAQSSPDPARTTLTLRELSRPECSRRVSVATPLAFENTTVGIRTRAELNGDGDLRVTVHNASSLSAFVAIYGFDEPTGTGTQAFLRAREHGALLARTRVEDYERYAFDVLTGMTETSSLAGVEGMGTTFDIPASALEAHEYLYVHTQSSVGRALAWLGPDWDAHESDGALALGFVYAFALEDGEAVFQQAAAWAAGKQVFDPAMKSELLLSNMDQFMDRFPGLTGASNARRRAVARKLVSNALRAHERVAGAFDGLSRFASDTHGWDDIVVGFRLDGLSLRLAEAGAPGEMVETAVATMEVRDRDCRTVPPSELALTWLSTLDLQVGTAPALDLTALSEGTHELTFTATRTSSDARASGVAVVRVEPAAEEPAGGVGGVYAYDADLTRANYCALPTSLTPEQCRTEFGVRHPGSYTMTLYPDGTGYVGPASPSTRESFWNTAVFIWEPIGEGEIRARSMATRRVLNTGKAQRSGLEVVYMRDGDQLRPRAVRLFEVQQIDYIVAPDGSPKPGATILDECGQDAMGTRVVVYAQVQPRELADYAVFGRAGTDAAARPSSLPSPEQAAAITAAFEEPARFCEGDGDVAR